MGRRGENEYLISLHDNEACPLCVLLRDLLRLDRLRELRPAHRGV